MILFALVVGLDLKRTHLNVKTALLNGLLDQPVFMKQPEGFELKNNENKMYHL